MIFVFTGPESSGKSTLVKTSVNKFGGGFVGEYAREYLQVKNGVYGYKDLQIVGLLQIVQEQLEAESHEYIWCDTDLLTILIWSKDKFKKANAGLIKIWKQQNFKNRHYFLCFPDIPWEYDTLRENPYDRQRLYKLYHDFLKNEKLSFSVLKGSFEEKQAIIMEDFIRIFPGRAG